MKQLLLAAMLAVPLIASAEGPFPAPARGNAVAKAAPMAPVLQNGWTNYGQVMLPAGFYKTADGIVHLEGGVRDGTSSMIFQLPEGYRPQGLITFMGSGTSNHVEIVITTDGTVNVSSVAHNALVSLNGIYFRAAP
jgi:hypothetical protein